MRFFVRNYYHFGLTSPLSWQSPADDMWSYAFIGIALAFFAGYLKRQESEQQEQAAQEP
jgi:hypothetical protein